TAEKLDTKPPPYENTMTRPVTVELYRVSLRRAVHAVATSASVRLQYQAELVDAVTTPVTLQVRQVSLGMALDRILSGTSLQAVVSGENLVTIKSRSGVMAPVQGTIVGKVIHGKTKQPVAGAKVTLDGAANGVITDGDGSFRIAV